MSKYRIYISLENYVDVECNYIGSPQGSCGVECRDSCNIVIAAFSHFLYYTKIEDDTK